MDAETLALLDVTRSQTRALAKHLRTVSRLHAQLADRLDEAAAQTNAQPKEAQRDDEQDE